MMYMYRRIELCKIVRDGQIRDATKMVFGFNPIEFDWFKKAEK